MSTPSARRLRVAIIGAGMSGIAAAIRMKELGHDYVVFEKADKLGGTWRENTYPGLACDVPAHLYTYSFARNPDWSRWHGSGAEIQRYFERVSHEFGVDRFIRYGDEVKALDWLKDRWQVSTASGLADRFDVVIAATGVLHHPNYPQIEGLGSFAGPTFHTARWDHGVTLDGKSVGVIGTGSTAAQITAAIVPRVKRLTLFQRTAQWIHPMESRAYSAEERARFRNDPATLEALIAKLRETFSDAISNAVIAADSEELKAIEARCAAHLDTVKDPKLREALRPDYRAGCKRLIFADDFYEAIQQPNAELVTAGIVRVEPEGVRTRDGRLHELDVLVLATGFRVDRFVRPIRVTGRGGRVLDDAWAKGPEAYLCVSVPDFPNFFMLNGPNGPVGNFSLIDTAELQLHYIEQLLGDLGAGRYREVSATRAALERFEQDRHAAAASTIWATGCKSWYLDAEGVPAIWTFSWARFREEMRGPKMADFDTR